MTIYGYSMSEPLVSAVIPAFNRPQVTQRAIDSVSAQIYQPIELVIVDDGSNPPLEKELSLQSDSIKDITVAHHDENRGANVARNTGIDFSNGEYIAFLDSDDEWAPEKIQRQIQRLEQKDSQSVSYTGVKNLDEEGNLNSIRNPTEDGDLLSELLCGNIIGTFSSVMISSETIEKVGRPNPDMPCWQDWEWYLRLATEVEFDVIEEALTIRHNGGDQISGSYTPKRDTAYPVILRQIKELASTSQEKRAGVAYLNYELARAAQSNKHYSEARQYYIRAIRHYPMESMFYIYLAFSGKHYPMARRLKRKVVRILSAI